ncbi:MAG: translocation/assembly module TamB domain-containing protein [Candidatus Mariimomonas ferrooxydans]
MKRNLLIAAATLFILLTLSVIYLFYTERGLRQMASFITSSVPGLSFKAVHGRLSGPLEITGITYKNDPIAFEIGKLSLNWKLSQLLLLRAHIVSLDADTIRIETQESKEPPLSDREAPELSMPLALIIDHATVRNIIMVQSGKTAPFEVQEASFLARMEGKYQVIELKSLEAQLLNGSVKSSGRLTLQPDLTWALKVEGTSLDPGVQWAEWPGKLNLKLSAQGDMQNKRHHIAFEDCVVWGELRGYPVRAETALEMKDGAYELKSLEIKSGMAHISASGSYSNFWDARWDIRIPDLGTVYPGAKGTIYGEGVIRGKTEFPDMSAMIKGDGVLIDSYSGAHLFVDIDIRAAQDETSKIDITAENIAVKDYRIKTFSLKGSGTASSHNLLLRTETEQGHADVAADAEYVNKQWKGRFTSGDLTFQDIGSWTLKSPALFEVTADKAETGDLCWLQGSSSVCVQKLLKQDRKISGNARASGMKLLLFNRLFPENVSVDGFFEATAGFEYENQTLTGSVSVNVGESTALYRYDEYETVKVMVKSIVLDTGLDTNRLDIAFNAFLTERGFIRGTASLPGFDPMSLDTERQEISGNLSAELKMLDLIPVFTKKVMNTAGSLAADMKITGTVAQPVLEGYLNLSDGTAHIPDLGIRLKDISMKIAGNKTGALDISGKLTSGEGHVLIKGTAVNYPEKPFSGELQVQGENFETLRIPSAKVIVSPDIHAAFQGSLIAINGTVTIPEASLEPRDLSNTVTASRDVRIIHETQEIPQDDILKLSGNITLSLGEKVKFKGFGLSCSLDGKIDLIEKPGQITQGKGEIHIINGKYKAYGQELDIEKGRLIFAGNIDSPGLDIRAVRKIKDVTSGVQATGTLQSPQLKVFSVPAMDESDALSYLLFGRPMRQLSGSEGSQLHSTALSAGLSGGGFIVKKIGARFGVEDVEIEKGTTPQSSALFLGKYLSPSLYVSYGIGLFEPVNTLRLRYSLSPRWLLQTEHGLGSGGDLLYKIER